MGATSTVKFILFDDATRFQLLPFTHTRPVADIRCGILTMRERWEKLLNSHTSTLTEHYLQEIFPLETGDGNVFINSSVFADKKLIEGIANLNPGEKLIWNQTLLAARFTEGEINFVNFEKLVEQLSIQNFVGNIHKLRNIWDIFSHNEQAIKEDFKILTQGRKTAAIPEHVIVSGAENLFIEKGAIINAGCIINATTGPVYIGKGAELLEGALLRGPIAVCDHAVIKMGAKIYGATTIGPGCKVGGELSNVVFLANSNKGHDGYLGNSVIGEWCNLGADTNCSNLKNNYDQVSIWNEHWNSSVKTGLQFCGLFMGDHSKCGINTMFNTGTVVGVSANIFGGGFPDKFIPSFSWGGCGETVTYEFSKALETANRMMNRRNEELSHQEMEMYRYVFELTSSQRNAH